ncbi:MAG: hypothetical protein ACI841_002894, partial [Planctomycetota bacterium]
RMTSARAIQQGRDLVLAGSGVTSIVIYAPAVWCACAKLGHLQKLARSDL